MKHHLAAALVLAAGSVGVLKAQVPSSLDLNLNNLSSFTGNGSSDQLYIYFSNGAAPIGGTPAFDVTYNNGANSVQFGSFVSNNVTYQNYLSNPIPYSTVSGGTFQVSTVNSTAVYVAYGNQFSTLSAAPGFFSNSTSGTNIYQNFELTRTGGQGDQGNLTNINYFTAPMRITSYAGTQQLQQAGYNQTTAQVYAALDTLAPSSKVVNSSEETVRFIGPSTYAGPEVSPYQSFIPYVQAVQQSGVTNTIQTSNGFNTNGSNGTDGSNYNFQINLTTGFTVSGGNATALVLSGNITTTVKDNSTGSTTPGQTFENTSVTFNLSNSTEFNTIVYGQAVPQNDTSVTYGSGWTDFANFVNDPTNNLTNSNAANITQALAIGELTSALLMGFLGNTSVVDGKALNTLVSSEWWQLDPLAAFSQVQSNSEYYNEWANIIYLASNNGVYSIPYSDRLGTGPLVNSVYYGGNYVTSWNVDIYDPVSVVPEPSTAALSLLVALGLIVWRVHRNAALKH